MYKHRNWTKNTIGNIHFSFICVCVCDCMCLCVSMCECVCLFACVCVHMHMPIKGSSQPWVPFITHEWTVCLGFRDHLSLAWNWLIRLYLWASEFQYLLSLFPCTEIKRNATISASYNIYCWVKLSFFYLQGKHFIAEVCHHACQKYQQQQEQQQQQTNNKKLTEKILFFSYFEWWGRKNFLCTYYS